MTDQSNANTVVVTRHVGTVEYLRQEGLIGPDTKILVRAKPEDIRDKHVFGVIPIYLACYAKSVSMISLDLPESAQGRELSAEEVREFCKGIRTFHVIEET